MSPLPTRCGLSEAGRGCLRKNERVTVRNHRAEVVKPEALSEFT